MTRGHTGAECDFGDGLFESVAFGGGRAVLWPWHMQRLRRDAVRLLIEPPDADHLLEQARAIAGDSRCVVRITVTRRKRSNYFPELDRQWRGRAVSSARIDYARRDFPEPAPGLRIGWASMHLADQPLLAGIKHLNRLEQILAAAEAGLSGQDELLLCDSLGRPVEAISSNLLVLAENGRRWLTPELQNCGVAGVMRTWLMEQGLVDGATLSRRDVERSTALALCNAVRGVRAVAILAGRRLDSDRHVAPLVAAVRELRGFA